MSPRKPTESGPHKDQGSRPTREQSARARSITACEKLCEVHDRVRIAADRVSRDIDDLTSPGIPVEIAEDDSLVIALDTIIKHKSSISG